MMMRFLTAMLMTATVAFADDIRFPVVRDGVPLVKVVVGTKHDAVDAAVADLAHYVEQISGAKLEIVHGDDDLPGPTLHIGETSHYEATAALREEIVYDGFCVRRIGEDLIVTGAVPEGTANGIVTSLHDDFDVRWYYAGPLWEIVPKADSLEISLTQTHSPDGHVDNPAFLDRRLWGRPPSDEFARRVRMTIKSMNNPFVRTGHALSRIVPTDKYAAEHPDYFSMMNGERVLSGSPQPCFTHPDMFDIFMEYVRGGGNSFGVNDNNTACHCERCLAIDGDSEPYMGMWNVSESYCQLIARVAKQTAKEFPGRRLGIFAYQITNTPPRTVEHLGANVDVTLCQDSAQHFDAKTQQTDRDMAAEWVRRSGSVVYYDYIGISYWTPRYFPTLLAEHIKHLHDVGVHTWATYPSTMMDTAMPMYTVAYELIWDTNQDAKQIVDRMLTDLYRESAGPMKRFYQHWEDCWMRQTEPRWLWGMDNFRAEMGIYSWADIKHGGELLAEAQSRATDPNVRERLKWIADRFAFTHAAAHAHALSLDALSEPLPEDPDEVEALMPPMVQAWRTFEREQTIGKKLTDTSHNGWLPRPYRVRTWGLKRQLRDATVAPFARWIIEREQVLKPHELTAIEARFAKTAKAARTEIESIVTEDVSAAIRPVRINALVVPWIPRKTVDIESERDWQAVPVIDDLEWIFRDRSPDNKPGKYEEILQEWIIPSPAPADCSITWKAAWDDDNLYVHVEVRDDQHVQNNAAADMWSQDGVQIAIDTDRADFTMPRRSWDYNWGHVDSGEIELGVGLRGTETMVYVWHAHAERTAEEIRSAMTARATRRDDRTVYSVAIPWDALAPFKPEPQRSLGISLVVNEVDDGHRVSAEYGSGVIQSKRATEFTAVRLQN